MCPKDVVTVQPEHTIGEYKSSESAQYKINFYGADFTLEVLNMKINRNEIIIPTFQRHYVWPITRASKLIESFLLGLPVPEVFLYREEKTQDLLIVDGHQRLKTINHFFSETFEDGRPFRLRGVKTVWEGKKFTELKGTEQRYLKNSVLRATIFEQTDPKDKTSMFEIFSRLNTGGMPLSYQEIRNCLLGGQLNTFLHQLNLNQKWRVLLNTPLPDRRMRDAEMILRFFALKDNWEKYAPTMRDFLTNYMTENRNIDEARRAVYKETFEEVINKLCDEIGPLAFRTEKIVNVAVFDSLTVAMAKIGVSRLSNFNDKYRELIKDNAYLSYVQRATTNVETVKGRIKIAIRKLS